MTDGPSWIERDARVVWHGFTQMSSYASNAPIVVERGEGRELIAVDGKRYLDAISSLWLTTLGHRVPELDAAVVEQLGRIAHSTMLGNGNRITVEFAEELARVVPVDEPHVLFASDGAAAVEQALKIAFQYWWLKGDRRRTTYLTLEEAYHGDTVGSLSVGGGGFGTGLFDPLRFPVLRAPSVPALIDMLDQTAADLAAVVVEPLVQGAAGMILHDPEALARLGRECERTRVLLVCDEVATGFGRTGTLFASEGCDLRPDILCLGKGLTGGYLPMSATVVSAPVYDAFLGPDLSEYTFYHGHSYGGNALGAAVALRHLRLLAEWDVLDNVRSRSDQLRALLTEHLSPHPAVKEIRLCGLMGGVELAPPAEDLNWGRRVCARAVASGVLLRPLGDVVVLMPMLTSSSDEIGRIVSVLESAVTEVCR